MTYTTQKQIRAAFWRDNSDRLTRKQRTMTGRTPTQNDYPADTRCAFVDYVDMLQRDGQISEALAERVTL